MRRIVDRFAANFAHWGLTLPIADVVRRRAGVIRRAGWVVQYVFGKDERCEYLDYYARHRMTEDGHVRLYADGSFEPLPALSTISRGRNAAIAASLAAKGFDLDLIGVPTEPDALDV